MKQSTMNEILGVLVTANRSDLAKMLVVGMSNEDFLRKFLDGGTGVDRNLKSLINNFVVLFHYDTPVAAIKNNFVFVNKEKYSATTTNLQNKIRKLAEERGDKPKDISELDLRKKVGLSETF